MDDASSKDLPSMSNKTSLFVYYIDGTTPSLSRTPQYPATLCKLEYLNEGGANVIYRVVPANEGRIPPRLERKLLRLRKNLRHCRPAAEQLKAFNDNFRQLFPKDNLVEHELVALGEGIITALNDQLRKRVRPSHRAQDFLYQDEQHGLLVTDLTPDEGEILVELKPKWLLQSPSAPGDAIRCRTCALRAQRVAKNAATATDLQASCPLMLSSASEQDRVQSARHLSDDEAIINYLATQAQSLLTTLRDCQAQLDDKGVLAVSGVDDLVGLCRAMTLRDCTLYIKRSKHGIEARLGDLDLKQPEKVQTWRSVERALIDEGWYSNTEHAEVLTREKICLLSRWVI